MLFSRNYKIYTSSPEMCFHVYEMGNSLTISLTKHLSIDTLWLSLEFIGN